MWFKSMWGRQQRIVRFLITGCTAAVVGFGTLILFADVLELWYLYASMLAYVAALLVNFTLQKQWVFVPYKNQDALRAVIQELLANDTKRKQMGAAGRTWAEQHVDPDMFARKLAEYLKKLKKEIPDQIAKYL